MKKSKTRKTKQELFSQIKQIDNILEEINQVIINNCILNGLMKEDGMYGKIYNCKKCNDLRGFKIIR